MALAAVALIGHPERAQWKHQIEALRRTIDSLWQSDGSFRTFYKPESRMDNQNFYPGEALLLWAILYRQEKDPAILQRFMSSFRYYRSWHLAPQNRNPAFIPWHTQAYYIVWEETKDTRLRDFIFEMNDWLLHMQQWGAYAEYRDTWGRFYNPRRPYGPPHASATGVYLEGLIDAYRLAVATGDDARAERYRLAIVRGIRSVMQLQFVDRTDMFYIPESQHSYVYGGMRTTVYDNRIRCDNVQHIIMALLKILDTFPPEAYDHP